VPAKTILYVIAALTIAVLVLYSAARGHPPDSASEWLAPVGPAVTAAGIGLWLFDRYLWRWPLVCTAVGRPVLHGTWHGELASSWKNPATGEGIPPDPDVFLVVRQRYWHVSARLLTKESSSASLLAELRKDADGVHQLLYVYSNTPKAQVRHRSDVHYGAVALGAPHDHTQGLEGHYFTDRKTIGELRFTAHRKMLAETYSAAERLFA
jgi:hypothetical protein